MDYILANWPISAVFIYLLLTDVFPKMLKFFGQYVFPERVKEHATKLKMEIERTEAERDLRERQIVAQEQLVKTLLLLQERLNVADTDHKIISAALVTSNSSLAVLLDRSANRRKEYAPRKNHIS